MKSNAIPTDIGFTMRAFQKKWGALLLFACLGCANLVSLAQAENIPTTNKTQADELVDLTVQQSSLWGQMLSQGKYEDALALNAGTEKKLNEALRQLETNQEENGNTPAKADQKNVTNIARLKYALSLVYFQQARSYAEMGSRYQLSSDFDKATPVLKDSALLMLKSWELMRANAPVIGIKVKQKLGLQASLALLNVAKTYQLQEELQAAQPLLEQSRVLLEQSTLPITDLWLYYINLARGYQQQGNFRQAEHYYQTLISQAASDYPDLPVARVYLAQMYQAQQRYTEAEQQLQLSLQQERTHQKDDDRPVALIPLASLHVAQKAYAKAEPLLQQALMISGTPNTTNATGLEKELESVIYLAVREMLGGVWLQLGKTDAARELFLKNSGNANNLLPPLSPGSKARSQEYLARLYEKRKDIPLALDWLQQAEQQYAAYPGENPEQLTAARTLARYRLWLLHLGITCQQFPEESSLPDIFETMQHAHGHQRTQALRQTALRLGATTPGIQQRLRNLWDKQATLTQLELYYAKSLASEAPAEIERLQRTLQQTRQQIDESDKQLQQDFPLYAKLVNPTPLTLEQTQRLLNPDEALLLWVLSERGAKSWLMVIRSDHTPTWHALNISKMVLQNVLNKTENGLLSALSDPHRPFNLKAAHGLYKTLFAPALDDLAGVRHIFAVPDGAMQNMPLHVLVKTAPSTTDATANYAQADWLMKHYAFSYLPSVQALANLRANPALPDNNATSPQRFIGFGDALHQGKQNNARTGDLLSRLNNQLVRGEDGVYYLATPDLLRQHFSPLPETARELRHIAKALNVVAKQSLFLGKDATESRLKQLDRDGILNRARILNFASHALLPPDSTQNTALSHLEPGLILTPPDSGSAEDDGYLSASEIASLRLNADWVVLSACNTGTLQAQTTHQGLSQLVNAFFLAGTKSVLASHWPVHSKATEQLMGELFNIWQKQPEKGRAEALRMAMNTLLNQSAACGWFCKITQQKNTSLTHPAYWAAFVIYGEGG